jgi:Cellulase M and related proteins
MKELLRELVETPGVSGDEHRIRDKIKTHVEENADSILEDDFGNLIVEKGSGEKTLMIMAHMDQIGLAVKRIDEDGYIRVSKVGGIYENGVINQRFKIFADNKVLNAVAGARPPHLAKSGDEDYRELPKLKDMFLDVGAEDKEHAKSMGIQVGDYISYDRELKDLEEDYVTGPAFDNRVGCAILIELLKRFDEDYELVGVFSAQEEVGTKGAKTSTFSVNPDAALALDIGMAGDTPGISPDESDDSLGDGAGIDMLQAGGRGLISSKKIRNWLIETAEKNDCNYFRSLYEGGATDAASIELQRDGIPTGSVGVPIRNLHSPTEVVKISDMKDTADYLEQVTKTLENYF